MCACSAIGNITTASIRKVRIEGSVESDVTVIDDVLQIVCLPCGWNAGTTRVIHGSQHIMNQMNVVALQLQKEIRFDTDMFCPPLLLELNYNLN